MIKAVIFDLDGTLVDTILDLQTAINCMLIRLGYKTKTKTDVLNAINNGSRELVRKCLPKEVQDVEFILESALEVYKEEYSRCYLDKSIAFMGVNELLVALRAKGIKLGVVTNKPERFAHDMIESLFEEKTFYSVVGQGSFPVKPNPTSTLLMLKNMGVKPSECLFVGDSDVDMITAKNVGARSVGVSWGYRNASLLTDAGANYIIHNPKSLVDIIEMIKQDEDEEKARKKLEKKQMRGKKKQDKIENKVQKPNEKATSFVEVKEIEGVEDGTQITITESDITIK
jgi:phosphoglycolate phosphatase